MTKNDDYFGEWCNVSIETWREFNKLQSEIDNVLSSKYVNLERINDEISKNSKRNSIDLLVNHRIHLSGEIKGLLSAQIMIGKILVCEKFD